MSKALTKEEFIKEAMLTHGDRYDYSKVEYKSTDTKVIIICKEHGEFLQGPKNHKKGQNCPKCMTPKVCGLMNRKGLTDFIKSSQKVFGELYDYSKSIYVDTDTKLEIICNTHGSFYRSPTLHTISGYGCPKCRKEEEIDRNAKIFIEKYKELYPNKYSLEDFVYFKSNTKSFAKCSTHGNFLMTPVALLNGNDCPKCAMEKQIKRQTKPLSLFLEESNKIHNYKFDYSLITEYKGSKSKVKIICPEHGIFEQLAGSHLNGRDCIQCAFDKKINYNFKEVQKEENKNKPLNFYIINLYSDDESFLKVGVTKNSIKARYYGSKVNTYFITELLFLQTNIEEAYTLEQKILGNLKKDFKYKPLKKFPGYTECLKIEAKNVILEEVKNYLINDLDRSPLVGKILEYEYCKI